MSALHFDQLIVNAAVRCGVMLGVISVNCWGLNDPWGSKSA